VGVLLSDVRPWEGNFFHAMRPRTTSWSDKKIYSIIAPVNHRRKRMRLGVLPNTVKPLEEILSCNEALHYVLE